MERAAGEVEEGTVFVDTFFEKKKGESDYHRSLFSLFQNYIFCLNKKNKWTPPNNLFFVQFLGW